MHAMSTRHLSPVCAFDITPQGATPVTDPWPAMRGAAGFRWLHLDLTASHTRDWIQENVPEIAAAALVQAETRPRFEVEETGIILNLRGVNMNPGQDADDMVSLRIWVTDGTVISARIRKIFAIDDLRAQIEAGQPPRSQGGLLVRVAKGLVDRIETVSLALEARVDALEDAVAPADVAPLRRSVIKLRRYVGPQREALEDFAAAESGVLDAIQTARMREVANRAARIVEELDAARDRLVAVQDHMDAKAQARLTHNNYLLAIVAAIFLPLGFVTGLFGVNVGGIPGADAPWAFALLCLGLLALGAGLALALKIWRWF